MVQGMGDDYQAGWSLNQGGWNWGNWFGGSGNPFMDIFAVTMANFKFQNYTGGGSMWNGFMGGGMGNFQMSPYGGAEYSFSGAGGGGSVSTKAPKTSDERIAELKVKNKHKAMTELLETYLKTLNTNGNEHIGLDDLLGHEGKPETQEGYDALKAYYTANKDKIITALKGTDEWKKNVLLNMNNTIEINGTTMDSLRTTDLLNGDDLKSEIDVMEYMEWSMTTCKSFFHLTNSSDEVKKVNKAIYKALKKKISDLKSGSSYSLLSKTTKDMLNNAYLHAADVENKDVNFGCIENKETKIESACAIMYYWLRMANAEVYASKYACLSDDFAEDALLGKNAIVNLTRIDLHTTEHFCNGKFFKRNNNSSTGTKTWQVEYDGS